MSRGDPSYDDIPPRGALTELRKLRLEHPELNSLIARRRKIVERYEVPYLGGISRDGETVYLDSKLSKLPKWAKSLIVLHEVVEWSLKRWIKGYEERHHMATAAEDSFAEHTGHSASEYRELLRPYYAPIEHEAIQRIPKDLDLSPYSGELKRTLEDLQRGKIAKISVDYGKGTAHRNCGLCSMFRKPDSCTLVAGSIRAGDVCDRFVRRLSS